MTLIGKVKFNIKYTWDRRELFEKTKDVLLSESWIIIDQILPCNFNQIKPNDIFICWFEREFNFSK